MQAGELRITLSCDSRLASKYYSVSEGSSQGTQLFLVARWQIPVRNLTTHIGPGE